MNGYRILAERDRSHVTLVIDDFPRVKRALPALAGGLLGAAVGGAHPVLSILLGSTLVRNAADVISGDATADQAVRRVGSHAVAAATSLAVPVAPMAGYGVGMLIGNALFGVDAPSLDAVREGKATLHRGMRGDAVTYVQALVGAVADGDFGSETEAAVKVFQKKVMVDPTGIVNRATMAGLDQLAGGSGQAPGSGEPLWRRTSHDPAPRTQVKSPSTTPSWSPPRQAPINTTAFVSPPSKDEGFLAAIRKPLWADSSITVWQGVALGLGGAALLGAGVSLLMPVD